MPDALEQLNAEIVRCRKCRGGHLSRGSRAPKAPCLREWEYWGKPVPGFWRSERATPGPGTLLPPLTARTVPGGCSRATAPEISCTKPFTAQASPINRPRCAGAMGSLLRTATWELHFAAPRRENKPLPSELANCRPYFERELELLRPRAILALGGIAMRAYLGLLKERGKIQGAAAFPFKHGASYAFGGNLPRLFVSYHPSQQNTFTGKLTQPMLSRVLQGIRRFLKKGCAHMSGDPNIDAGREAIIEFRSAGTGFPAARSCCATSLVRCRGAKRWCFSAVAAREKPPLSNSSNRPDRSERG